MYEVVQVRLKKDSHVFLYDTNSNRVIPGKFYVVEDDRGITLGEVISEPEILLESEVEEKPLKIIRLCTPEDLKQLQTNQRLEKEGVELCSRLAEERKLPLKAISAEYSFDRSKIVICFSSEERIDFRELVKDLAARLKARIELRQIGVRDEAKKLGGFGACGCPLCCSRFLKDFQTVTIRMAKEQNLSLNPMKISGLCGRLMCCLGYEQEFYQKMRGRFPRVGTRIHAREGAGTVIGVNLFKKTITLETEGGARQEINWEEKKRRISILNLPFIPSRRKGKNEKK